MKFLLILFFMISCSLNKKSELPVFDKTKDCSEKALQYSLSKYGNNKIDSAKNYQKISHMMKNIAKSVKSCYQKEIDKNKREAYNLCLITGYDKNGNQDFLSFSVKKKEVTGDLGECLNNIKNSNAFKTGDFNNITIVQPYRLHPERN